MALCYIRAIFLLLIFAFCDGSNDGHNSETGHGNEHGHGGVVNVTEWLDHIVEYTGATQNAVNETNIKDLLQRLNFVDCTNEHTTLCNLCFNASDVMEWFRPENNKSYTTKEFHNVLHGILYLIINNNGTAVENCKTVKQNIMSKSSSNIFRYFRDERWGVANNTAVESVQAILDDIKFAMGVKLDKKECYNGDDVLKRTSIHGGNISETSFKSIVVFLTYEIIHGKCILPKKTIFIEDTLTRFGNKTHLNETEFKALVTKLNLGKNDPTHDPDHEHEGEEHNHKRRRRSIDQAVLNNDLNMCYSAEELLKIYHVSEGENINRDKLQEIEAALVQQIERKTCAKAEEAHKDKKKGYEDWQPWVATMIAVLILTIGSCAGYLATPLQSKKWFPYLMLFMISLAVAVLTGDAMLHLFPHSLDLHGHGHGEEGHDGHEEEGHGLDEILAKDSYIWKSLLFLVGGYIFFTFELFMKAFGGDHSHSHPGTDGTYNQGFDKSYEAGKVKNGRSYNVSLEAAASIAQNDSEGLKDLSVISEKAIPIKSFKSVAWMILLGDALHNFLDGLAIGAAFSADWPSGKFGGISTSIAIFCHEVPHELGDFAVLLASGLSVNQALVMNYISALTAFLGGIVGCAVGTTSNATPWIFAITGGLFVYLALTNMLPEAINSSLLRKTPWLSIFIIQIGVIIGYVIMFVLGVFEEEIQGTLE